MRSTVGRQLNSKAERWYHGEGRRQERKHGATASPEFLTGDLTGAGDPPPGTPLLSSAVPTRAHPTCPVRLATPPGHPLRTSRLSGSYRAQQHNPFSARQVDRDHFALQPNSTETGKSRRSSEARIRSLPLIFRPVKTSCHPPRGETMILVAPQSAV